MKKRILAMVLALSMMFTFISVYAAEPTLKEAIVNYTDGRGLNDAVVYVPLDVQVRESGTSEWKESLTLRERTTASIPKFDFMATLDMSAVKEAFDVFVLGAGNAIETEGGSVANKATLTEALEAVSVTGTFNITVKIPDGVTVPDAYKENNQTMFGFDDGAKEIFKEVSRNFTANEATIEIAVKDSQTKATLEEKIGRAITFTVEGVEVNDFKTYKLEGKLEGETTIGGDIATVSYVTEPMGTIGGVNHNPDGTDAPWASAIVKINKTSGSGGGSSTVTDKEYTVEFIVDGETYKTVESEDKAVDLDAVTPTEKEGYEFAGWYLDKELTKPASSPLRVQANTKVYAKYVVKGTGDGPVLNTEDHSAYIIGYVDGTVKPLNNIVREEVATIFFRLLTDEAGEAMHEEVAPYSDVPATRWSSTAIATLAHGGYITGRPDGTFGPSDYITRAEFAAIAARFTKPAEGEGIEFSDVEKHWAKNYIEACAASGLITGYTDGTFKPDQYITRAEAMAIVNRMLGRAVDAKGIETVKDDIYYFADNAENTWCYYIVLEATNSHDYTVDENGAEVWTKVTEVRDWTTYEK